MKVRYVGCTSEQVAFGNNEDPRPLLKVGEIYTVHQKEVHTWHTKYFLSVYPTLPFNSVSFEVVDVGSV